MDRGTGQAMKVCNKCSAVQPCIAFSRNRCAPDGLNHTCKSCVSIRMKAYNAKIMSERGDEIKRAGRDYRIANKIVLAERKRVYVEKNQAAVHARQQAWYLRNRDALLAKQAERYANDSGYRAARMIAAKESTKRRAGAVTQKNSANRRAVKAKRTPPWADMSEIERIYKAAAQLRRMGIDVHVDHFYPLRGRTVSGLHVHQNLSITLAGYNHKKGDRMPHSEAQAEAATQEVVLSLCTPA